MISQWLLGVSLVAVIAAQEPSAGTRDRSDPRTPPQLETALYERFKQPGWFQHPDVPWVFKAQRVEGEQLQDVWIGRRTAQGKGYDFLGRAHLAKLGVDSSSGQLYVRLTELYYCTAAGDFGWVAEKVWCIDLPTEPAYLLKPLVSLPQQETPLLSPAADRFLAGAWKLLSVEEKLQRAFGENCPELQRAYRLENRLRRLLLAFESFSVEADGRLKATACSLARFSAELTPTAVTVRSPVAYITYDQPVSSLNDLANRQVLTIECANGVRINLDQ